MATAHRSLLLLLTVSITGQPAPNKASADPFASWWAHVEFLASDKLAGRNAGSPGHKAAAEYVAAKFRQAGLAPCGEGGSYVQPVPLVQKLLDEPQSSLSAVMPDGRVKKLALGDEAAFSTRGELPAQLAETPAVFLGYAFRAPGHDDFAGQDVRGKIVVAISGSPANLAGPLRAHFSSAAERSKALTDAGAAGMLLLSNPKNSDVPWDRTMAVRLLPSMAIDGPLGAARAASLSASLNTAKSAWIFDGAPLSLDALLDMSTAGKPLPRFPLAVKFTATARVEKTKLKSENICGVLKGRNTRESVVLSAHIDHLGENPAAEGADKIYNGAMDNASGIATLIETARWMRTAGKPARSIVFVAVTAEEKGLLGSHYFAQHPPAQAGTMVANINMDMFLPIHAMKKVMVFGGDESTLRAPLEAVAGRLGLGVQNDLEPARNRFIRSDQYSFIQRGIPALALKVGYDMNTPEAAIQKEWTAKRYHALADDLQQPVDRDAAVTFNRLIRELAREVANAPTRPEWRAESFFRRFATAQK